MRVIPVAALRSAQDEVNEQIAKPVGVAELYHRARPHDDVSSSHRRFLCVTVVTFSFFQVCL